VGSTAVTDVVPAAAAAAAAAANDDDNDDGAAANAATAVGLWCSLSCLNSWTLNLYRS